MSEQGKTGQLAFKHSLPPHLLAYSCFTGSFNLSEADALKDSILNLSIELDNLKMKSAADCHFVESLQADIAKSAEAQASVDAEFANLKSVLDTSELGKINVQHASLKSLKNDHIIILL